MHDEQGVCRYWRAPRPRPIPRPHRRQTLRRKRQIVRAVLSNDRPLAEAPANKAIRVLQASLLTVILRVETAERKLQAARSASIQDCDMHAASGQLNGPPVALGAAQKTTPKLYRECASNNNLLRRWMTRHPRWTTGLQCGLRSAKAAPSERQPTSPQPT